MILRKYRSRSSNAAVSALAETQSDPWMLLKQAEKIGRDAMMGRSYRDHDQYKPSTTNDRRSLQLLAFRRPNTKTPNNNVMMKCIDMRGCNVSKTDIDIVSLVRLLLRESPHVTTVDLSWIGLGDEKAAGLCRAIQSTPSVREVILSGNELGKGDSSGYIGEFLRTNKSVVKLSLGANTLGKVAAESLARGLRENSTLEELDLWNCSIGDEVGAQILESARYSKNLRVLRLNMNKLGQRSLEEATRLLETPTAMTALNLDSNPNLFGRENLAEEAFVHALEMNQNLLTLGLPYTGVTDFSAKLLFEAMTTNVHLEYLDIGYNDIRKDGYARMVECIPNMKNLKHLRTHARAQLVSSDALSKAIERNTSLHQFTSICVGCSKVWASLRRNQVISRANKLASSDDIPQSLLPKAINKFAAETEGGTTAIFQTIECLFR